MSRGQTPRTPEHFPRMNDRAGRRRARREVRRAVKTVTSPSFADTMRQLADTMRQLADTANKIVEAFAEAFRPLTDQVNAIADRFAEGGMVQGPRPDDDSIPVMLSPAYHSLDGGQTWSEEPTAHDDSVLESRVPELNPWSGMGVVALHSHPADVACDEQCSVYDRADRPADE